MACYIRAPSHYLTNVDLSPIGFSGIQLWPISQQVLKISVLKMGLNTVLLKLQPQLIGANELNLFMHQYFNLFCFMGAKLPFNTQHEIPSIVYAIIV